MACTPRARDAPGPRPPWGLDSFFPPQTIVTGAFQTLGAVRPPEPGTLEHFLTERYCLYTVDKRVHACRLDIHHPRRSLQDAEADLRVNTMAEAAGLRLPGMAPLLHFAKRQDMVAWPLEPIGAGTRRRR